jgi:hypothetical protein
MTVDRISELYLKGLYSQIDFYLGIVDLLVDEPQANHILERIPQPLLGLLAEMAHEHAESAGAAGATEEQRIPQTILRWRHDHPDGVPGTNGTNGAAASPSGFPLVGVDASASVSEEKLPRAEVPDGD